MNERRDTLKGIGVVAILTIIAISLSKQPFFIHLGVSPLIIGIALGMVYANSFKKHIPTQWQKGVIFCTKTVLRTAIVFYGFRLTLGGIYDIGFEGVAISVLVVATTYLLGTFVGVKILNMDRSLVTLTSAGSAICGAAAVLATEPVIKAKPYKSAVAVSTVVLFGTLSMFLYPFAYKLGFVGLSPEVFGIYIGGTLHEVAHVVGAAGAIGEEAAKNAIVVKMTRVMALAPFLMILSFFVYHGRKGAKKSKVRFPFFALMFIVVVLFNSLNLLSPTTLYVIEEADNFGLTMAMTALGMESSFDKFKQAGKKPFILALILFLWLVFGGYFMVSLFF